MAGTPQSSSLVVLPLLSGSMAKALLPGDMLSIQPLGPEKAHQGDIIVYRLNGKLIAHRLLLVFRMKSVCLLLEKGDANSDAALVIPHSVVGRVEAACRNGQEIFSRSPQEVKRGRRRATVLLFRYLLFDAPKTLFLRILGRVA